MNIHEFRYANNFYIILYKVRAVIFQVIAAHYNLKNIHWLHL